MTKKTEFLTTLDFNAIDYVADARSNINISVTIRDCHQGLERSLVVRADD